VRCFAIAGVKYSSIGALTHSAPALDLSLEMEQVGTVEAVAGSTASRTVRKANSGS